MRCFGAIAASLRLCDKCYLWHVLPALPWSRELDGSPGAQGLRFQESCDSSKIVISWLDVMTLKGYPFLPLFLARLSLLSLFFSPVIFIPQLLSLALSFSNTLSCSCPKVGVPLSILNHFCSKLCESRFSYLSLPSKNRNRVSTRLKHQHHKLQLFLCKTSSQIFLVIQTSQVRLAPAA